VAVAWTRRGAERLVMHMEEKEEPPGPDGPEAGALRAGSHDPTPVRAESRLVDDGQVSLEHVQAPLAANLPDPRVAVTARRDGKVAVGAEGSEGQRPPVAAK